MKIDPADNREKSALASVSREIIIRGPTTHIAGGSVDVVVSLPNEPASVERVIAGASTTAVTARSTQPVATIWSPIQVAQARSMQILRSQLALTWPFSVTTARFFSSAALVRREVVPGDQLFSYVRVAGAAAYVIQQVSAVGIPRSPTRIAASASLALIHRYTTPVASSGIDVAGVWSTSVVTRNPPALFSRLWVGGATTWSISSRTVENPKSNIRVSTSSQHAVVPRVVSAPISSTQVRGLAAMALVLREPATAASIISVAGLATYAIARRPVSPLGRGWVYQSGQSVVLARTVQDLLRSWRMVLGLQQVVLQPRPVIAPENIRSALKIKQAQSTVLVARWTLHPDLISDPSTGRHVSSASLHFLLSRPVRPISEVMHPDAGQHVRAQIQHVIVRASYPDIRRPRSRVMVTQLCRQTARRMQMPTAPAPTRPIITISWGW